MNNRKNLKKSVLVISAHADDHIACAGTLFKLRNQGYYLYEVVLTTSGEGRDYRKGRSGHNTEKLRDKELGAASRFLGTQKLYRLGQEDFGLCYSKNLVLRVVEIVREVKPMVGVIHHQFDWHPDHQEAYKIGNQAFKMAATGIKPKLGEHWRTPIVLAAEGMLPIKPNVLVDITKYAPKKKQLWELYESQARPQALSFDESLMRVRGYHLRRAGSIMAEAFSTDLTSPIILFDEQ